MQQQNTRRRTLWVIAGAVLIQALALTPVVGDTYFVAIVVLGPPITGAAAVALGRPWRPVAAAWALAGLVMLVVDWVVNGEDQLFHLLLAVLMAGLAALGAQVARAVR